MKTSAVERSTSGLKYWMQVSCQTCRSCAWLLHSRLLHVCRHAQEQAEHDAVAAQLESARSQFKEFERKDVKAGTLLALLSASL